MNALSSLVVGNALLVLPLALLAAGVTALGRRPALAHGLWLLVLLKLVTPPFVALPVPAFLEREPAPVVAEAPPPALPVELPATMLPDFEIELLPDDLEYLAEVEPALEELPAPRAETPVVAAPPAEAHAPSRTFTIGPYLAPALGLLWLTGSASWLLLTWVRVRRFQRLLRHAAPATPALRSQAEQVAARLGLSRCPEVQLLPGALSPMLWGLFGPTRLLLPAELFARLDAEQRATLLAHELAHLRRRDHWVRGLEVLATTLYWWHPALWWARRALREAEEQCCDAWVVWALPDAARQYATALLATVDFLSDDRPALPALASGAGQFPILKRRLTMILRGTPPRTLSTTGLLGIVGLGLLLLPVVPTWAQPPGAEPEKRDVKIVVDTIKFTEADPKKAEEVEKAKLELKKLADEMLRMQEQFRNAQKHFEEAAKKLAEMEGGPGKRVFLFEKKLDGVPMVPGVPGVPDVLQFKLRADPFAHESAAKKQDELKLAERDLAELKKHLETIKELLKDQEAGKQATAAIEAMLKRKAAEVADRRAELARLEKEGPKPVVRAFGPDDAVAFAKLKAREAELHASTVQLDAAKARLERFRQLRERKLVSDDEVKTAEVDVARFEAELQAKKADLLATQARTKPAAPAATPTAPRPPDKPAGSDQRIAELEKRLELLLREVQGLRQDLGNKPTPKPSNR